METVLDSTTTEQLGAHLETFLTYLLSLETLIELGTIVILAAIAWLIVRRAVSGTDSISGHKVFAKSAELLRSVAFPFIWLLLQWAANLVAHLVGWRDGILFVTASLLTAWIVIHLMSAFIRNAVIAKAIALLAWTVAALNILGLVDSTAEILDSVGMSFGDSSITLLTLFKGIVSLAALLWASNLLAEFFESRIHANSDLTPSVQVLFTKLLKMALFGLALIAAVSAVGIDLTAFAFLGGAIGVGIGLGLQKIVSNLFSGMILLIDNSIKPGDVIAVGEYYGRVESLGARYVSVATRDGTEHLIPNEDLIINRVENWSHTNNLLRLRLGVGVHYKSDVKKAMQLCLDAALEAARVLKDPKPTVLMRKFGDSSVDLEIRYWISDPMNGRANVASDVLVRVWDKFAENGIEIPYPQRDIHFRTPLNLAGRDDGGGTID